MIKKKKINQIKTKSFLNEFPIIFLLQHNNFSVDDWSLFKQKIQEISNAAFHLNKSEMPQQLKIFNIKNSLLKKNLLTEIHSLNTSQLPQELVDVNFSNLSGDKLQYLCQGPNFVIGCKNHNHLSLLWNVLNSNSKCIFIACLYKKQLLNHLDIEILLKTDFSIYSNLIENLDKKTEFYDTLQYHLKKGPLISIQHNLLNILSLIK